MLIAMLIQIIFESLPVSSSGHVSLLERLGYCGLIGDAAVYQTFDFLLHGPALLIMLIYFFKTWWKMVFNRQFSWSQIGQLTTYQKALPVVWFVFVVDMVTFVFWYSKVSDMIKSYSYALTVGFCVTAIMLYATRFLVHSDKKLSWCISDALILGVAQGVALLPGISRFATTFFVGNVLGYSAQQSFALSFMIQMPLVCAAFAKGLFVLAQNDAAVAQIFDCVMVCGIVVATLLSYAVLQWVGNIIQRQHVWYFALYMLVPIIMSLII